MIKVAAQLAYRNFQKRAVSRELAQRALFGKSLRVGLDDIMMPSANAGTIDRVRAILKKYPKAIRKAGPEARRFIYGPPAMELKMPETFTANIWKPDSTVVKQMAQTATGIRR